ncbi:2-amino-4-hydroxy-6-hydroxymethyldihydropteridine diphosphokinase [Jonesia quinghaiensis]|uniref:2-amino-4-hydroxy-6- hydroxymethyldihydropteridine diphosphokinase n=1 Tax=Jonesia quinghaiensis TaxID=262806 RepID=UPI000415A01E|nr:2-amino-4-hydroxy-6-hydroxymethyldihydropteridine diphosphokinase [Jonesia quinghaiensis]
MNAGETRFRATLDDVDTIQLTGLQATGYHGVLQSEREEGQTFLADITLFVDISQAGRSDDLTDTVNYALIAEDVVGVLSGEPVNLIETVAERIADRVLAYAQVSGCIVTVHKPQAPISVPFSNVAVTIQRRQVTSTEQFTPQSAINHRVERADEDPAPRSTMIPVVPSPEEQPTAAPSAVSAAGNLPSFDEIVLGVETPVGGFPVQVQPDVDQDYPSEPLHDPTPEAPTPQVPVSPQEPITEPGTSTTMTPIVVPTSPTHPSALQTVIPTVAETYSPEFPHVDVATPHDAASLQNTHEASAPHEFEEARNGYRDHEPDSHHEYISDEEPQRDGDAQETPIAMAGESAVVDAEPHSHDTPQPDQSASGPESARTSSEFFAGAAMTGTIPAVSEAAAEPHRAPTLSELLGGDANTPLDMSKPLFAMTQSRELPPLPKPFLDNAATGATSDTPAPRQTAAPHVAESRNTPTASDVSQQQQDVPPVALPQQTAEGLPQRSPSPVSLSPEEVVAKAVPPVSRFAPPEPGAYSAPARSVDDVEPAWQPTFAPEIAEPSHHGHDESPVADSGQQPLSVDIPELVEDDLDDLAHNDHLDHGQETPNPQLLALRNSILQETHIPDVMDDDDLDPLDREPESPTKVVLALGANLGDAQQALSGAVQALHDTEGFTVVDIGPLARTAAVGGPDQPDYLNTVIIGETTLAPRDLLRATQAIENAHGRVREEHWGPRTLDIDIVVYEGVISSTDELELPHPRAHERAFVLVPWAQIDPDAELPGLGGGPVADLADTAPDRSGVRWLALDWVSTEG